jgi:predicted RNase H-like nuclease (RuvC/YqgF family)
VFDLYPILLKRGDHIVTDNNKEIYESETKQEKVDNPVKRETVMKLASDLLKDETSIDMGSIMKMATNLFKDDTLMSSVKDLAKLNQNKPLEVSKELQEQEGKDMTSLHQHIEDITHELTELKQKLQDMKKQNEHLREMILNQEKQQTEKDIEKADKDKRRDQQIMILIQELQETKESMAAMQKKKWWQF